MFISEDILSMIMSFSGERERRSICLVNSTGECAYRNTEPTLEGLTHDIKYDLNLFTIPDFEAYIRKFKPEKLYQLIIECYKAELELTREFIKLNNKKINIFISTIPHFDSSKCVIDVMLLNDLRKSDKCAYKNMLKFTLIAKYYEVFVEEIYGIKPINSLYENINPKHSNEKILKEKFGIDYNFLLSL